MRWIAVWVILISAVAGRTSPALRPSARMMFAQPEFLHAGTCVMVREGGAGWIATDPVFWLKGTVAGRKCVVVALEVCRKCRADHRSLQPRGIRTVGDSATLCQ